MRDGTTRRSPKPCTSARCSICSFAWRMRSTSTRRRSWMPTAFRPPPRAGEAGRFLLDPPKCEVPMLPIMLALALAAQSAGDAAAVVKELEQIEQQLAATWKKGDCDGWGRIVAPEWSVIHIDANTLTRAQALQMCRSGEPPIDELTIGDVSV